MPTKKQLPTPPLQPQNPDFLIYTTSNGKIKLDVRLELEEKVVCSILELTTSHGFIPEKTQQQKVKFYNLDAIIAIGC